MGRSFMEGFLWFFSSILLYGFRVYIETDREERERKVVKIGERKRE